VAASHGPRSGIWLIYSTVSALVGGKPTNNSAVVKHTMTITKYKEVVSSPCFIPMFITCKEVAHRRLPRGLTRQEMRASVALDRIGNRSPQVKGRNNISTVLT
jgi:hypothetical protein